MDPVPMNIGLIVGVAVAIAVLLCMLAYVVYKCAVAGQRPVAALAPEKTALAVGGDLCLGRLEGNSSVNGRLGLSSLWVGGDLGLPSLWASWNRLHPPSFVEDLIPPLPVEVRT